ncbi:MAG: VTT domain-containing protein [Candidatus Nitrotoga sp.]
MDLLLYFTDIVLHLDKYLLMLTQKYDQWIYAILFLIIFLETGVVVLPFLPGDSLLFVAGALCGLGVLQIGLLMPLLMIASFSGDNTNYWVGRTLGLKLVNRPGFFNKEHINRAQSFYQQHGGKTIIFARFLPIVRTFAPFVAGIGQMQYRLFLAFSALGSVAWISTFVVGGYFMGNIPVVKDNLTLAVLIIVTVSLLPVFSRMVRQRNQ